MKASQLNPLHPMAPIALLPQPPSRYKMKDQQDFASAMWKDGWHCPKCDGFSQLGDCDVCDDRYWSTRSDK
jgi:hypothetical protein